MRRSSTMSVSQTTHIRSWTKTGKFKFSTTPHSHTTSGIETEELKASWEAWGKMELTDQLQMWGVTQQK